MGDTCRIEVASHEIWPGSIPSCKTSWHKALLTCRRQARALLLKVSEQRPEIWTEQPTIPAASMEKAAEALPSYTIA